MNRFDKLESLIKALRKEVNESYSPGANDGGDGMAMAEKEPHEDDPKHEAKEKRIAEKEKELAQELIDMHKGETCTNKQDCQCFSCRQNRLAPPKAVKKGEALKIAPNGQWRLEPLRKPKA